MAAAMSPGIQPGMWPPGPWTYPDERYYYSWWDKEAPPPVPPGDADIKSLVVDQLKTNTHTKDEDIRVDVKQGVAILGGQVSTWLAKRAAGDDTWDTPGVVDVSNQLEVVPST